MKDEILEFLVESNHIEGVYDEDCDKDAYAAWQYAINQDAMSLPVILETHRILMQRREAWDDSSASILGKSYIGALRDGAVYIGGKPALHHLHIREHLDPWIEAMNTRTAHPDLNWKQLHVDYETIHPFFDGNGRTGRIFMNWWRVKNGLPVLVIHVGKEQMEYYNWFKS